MVVEGGWGWVKGCRGSTAVREATLEGRTKCNSCNRCTRSPSFAPARHPPACGELRCSMSAGAKVGGRAQPASSHRPWATSAGRQEL